MEQDGHKVLRRRWQRNVSGALCCFCLHVLCHFDFHCLFDVRISFPYERRAHCGRLCTVFMMDTGRGSCPPREVAAEGERRVTGGQTASLPREVFFFLVAVSLCSGAVLEWTQSSAKH